ncbi:hypothetical protein E27107_80066 [Elizabethkingia anophelis]|nr:hypothetical protein E18064_190111 [Elizabethkingia anophelis]CDN79762.1 hypothetical protein E27107_80066 [Elizabethkingia anophelis]
MQQLFQLKQNKFITFANENLKSLNINVLNTEYTEDFFYEYTSSNYRKNCTKRWSRNYHRNRKTC